MPRFEARGADLYIDGKKVQKAWEEPELRWYWFGVEKNVMKKATFDGKEFKDDTLWYGLIQGFVDKWAYFSQAELEDLKLVKEIKKKDLPYAGRR